MKITDPLGLLSPINIIPKLIIQELWKVQIDWDQPVPVQLNKQWEAF